MRALVFVILVFFLLAPSFAYAKCASPSGAAGASDFQYASTGSSEFFCDDSDTWKLIREVDDTGAGVRQLFQIGDDVGSCTGVKFGRLRYT